MKNDSMRAFADLLNVAGSWAYGRPVDEVCVANALCETICEVAAPAGGVTIADIAQKIAVCTHCGLCKTRKNVVPGFGAERPLVMVIGEGPGADENSQGLPFVGSAGQLLDKMLASIQLSRHSNCFIGNIVKCRPPHNRDPLPEESVACAAFLQAQIHVLRPKMILAVGRIATQNLLGTTEGIGKLHGRFFDYSPIRGASQSGGACIPLMAMYHPSALLRDSSYKKPTWDDLKLFRSKLEDLAPNYAELSTQGSLGDSNSSSDSGHSRHSDNYRDSGHSRHSDNYGNYNDSDYYSNSGHSSDSGYFGGSGGAE